MHRHRIVSHKDTKEFGKMVGKLTLKQIILFNGIILSIGAITSIVMDNVIPVLIAGFIAFVLSNKKKHTKD
jgi:hypothetical protein